MSVGGGEQGSLVFGVEDLVKLSLFKTKFPTTSLGPLLAAAKMLCLHNLAISSELLEVGGGGCIKLGGRSHGNIEAENVIGI